MYRNRFMCAMNGFIQAHGFGGRPGSRFQPVKGAIDEGDSGQFKGEPRKAVLAGIRWKELNKTPRVVIL